MISCTIDTAFIAKSYYQSAETATQAANTDIDKDLESASLGSEYQQESQEEAEESDDGLAPFKDKPTALADQFKSEVCPWMLVQVVVIHWFSLASKLVDTCGSVCQTWQAFSEVECFFICRNTCSEQLRIL